VIGVAVVAIHRGQVTQTLTTRTRLHRRWVELRCRR
jgi:hypothetical protein